jgi:lysophospholipase L1-like esterase
MKNKFIYLSVLVVAGLVSCEPEFENAVDANYSAGEADFSSYVAVGNSLTAGYMDGTVSKGGQANSFPNLLSQQFATVGGGAFTQPSYEEDVNNLGGIAGIPGFGTRLVINASVGAPQPIAGTSTITLTPQASAYNNMGVPGAKSFHLLAAGYGNAAGLPLGLANPYYVRHATSVTSTVLGDAVSKNPTFFTNWIGANDILSYATSGGAKADGSPAADHNTTGNTNPATYGGNDITHAAVFAGAYSVIIDQLTANGAKGVVATIPSVTSIPYFTTVPYDPLTVTTLGGGSAAVGAATIQQLNTQLYGPLKGIFSAYGEPNRVKLLSATTANPILIYDADAADRTVQITGALTPTLGAATAAAFGAVFGKARQATAADLIVLPASSVIGTPNASSPSTLINVNGVSFPMANKWVLTSTEAAKVATATMAYNSTIKTIASSKNLAVADMNAILGVLVNGLRSVNGQIYTANYFSGSATEVKVLFSLDGVHPNARGYAVIANEILKVINAHYKSNIPFLNPSYFPGINIVATN